MTRSIRRANGFLIICSILILFISKDASAQYRGGSGDGYASGTLVEPNNPLLDLYHGGNEDGYVSSTFVQPDNPQASIYFGGNEDGYASSTVIQPDDPQVDIYKGGLQDGYASFTVIQPDDPQVDIYKGGLQDGFAMTCFIQPDDPQFDIYKGGVQDGFVMACIIQPDDPQYDIYKGGNQDGFSMFCIIQPSSVFADIYKGGNGDGFNLFCIGGIGTEVPLPIQLINFTARYQENVVLVQWKTATELNNDYFVVERSTNGVDFIQVYKIAGAGTSTQTHNYSFTDEGPEPGINYYRLKQVDYDGTVTYSGIVSVLADITGPTMTVVPNPSDNSSTVNIRMKGVGSGTPVELTVTTVYGQVITTYETTLDEHNGIKLQGSFTSTLAPGFYVVTVRFSTGHITTKWVVK